MKSNQVCVLENERTLTNKYVDAKDLVLNLKSGKTLGTTLNEYKAEIKALQEENKALKKAVSKLTALVEAINLKNN